MTMIGCLCFENAKIRNNLLWSISQGTFRKGALRKGFFARWVLRKEFFAFCEEVTYREIMAFKYFM